MEERFEAARSKYARLIKQEREEGYDSVYLDKTWVNSYHTQVREWQSMGGAVKRNYMYRYANFPSNQANGFYI